MPLYEYKCDSCGRSFEVIQRFSDPAIEECRHCGAGPVHKVLSAPAIQFKGSGWYVTDYARKGTSEPSRKSEGNGSSSAESAKDTKDTKDAKDTKDTAKSTSDSSSSASASSSTKAN